MNRFVIAWIMILVSSFSVRASAPFPGEFDKTQVPTNSVFIYKKSNIDGSHASRIAVYYHNELSIEAFKWTPGNSQGTSVRAQISPETLNVIEFNAASVMNDGEIIPRAKLKQDMPGQFSIQLGDHQTITMLDSTQWHSYDFDFASLAYAYRHLSAAKDDFTFTILDLDMNQSPPPFVSFGKVTMQFDNKDDVLGKNALRYNIDGPGLDNRGGKIWFDASSKAMLLFEIEKPDERGYQSNRMELLEQKVMTPEQWQAFKQSRLSDVD